MTAEAISGTHWKIVELSSLEFHRSLAVAILSKGGVKSEDLFLELAPFHHHIYTIDCYQWLEIHSTHRIRGASGLCSWGSTCILVTVEGKAIRSRDPARRAKELLQLMTSLPSSELKAPCAGVSLVISAHGVSASLDDDTFPFVGVDACEEAECQSPMPGPLENPTTWILLTRLGWKLEQRVHRPLQHHVLQVVRDWSLLLLAWLCVGLYEWCATQHPFIVGDPVARPWRSQAFFCEAA